MIGIPDDEIDPCVRVRDLLLDRLAVQAHHGRDPPDAKGRPGTARTFRYTLPTNKLDGGKVIYLKTLIEEFSEKGFSETTMPADLLKVVTNEFFRSLDEIQPFIFHGVPSKDVTESARKEHEAGGNLIDHQEFIKNAPFRVFSIENASGQPLSRLYMGREEAFKGVDLEEILSYEIEKIWNETLCILAFEMSPESFFFMELNRCNSLRRGVETGGPLWVMHTLNTHGVASGAIETIYNSQLGNQTSGVKYKLKHRGIKSFHKIKGITHVRPKHFAESNEILETSRHVEWTHRFFVRGHWRDLLGGIGKDRSGGYTVRDKTWVTEHIKGDAALPLITKTRIVGARE